MNIPVFHDDQHGTAIIVAAAIRNGLLLQGKQLEEVKLVTSGAGAAALACVDLLVSHGPAAENVTLTDIKGVVYAGPRREHAAQHGALRPRHRGAHAGRRAARRRRVPRPVRAARAEARMAGLAGRQAADPGARQPRPGDHAGAGARGTGRTRSWRPGGRDYPNQVNNVLCFPFIFRGALDVGATDDQRGDEASPPWRRSPSSRAWRRARWWRRPMAARRRCSGRDYIIPKPFDPRLILQIAPAVARAAMASGVATRPIEDFDAYQRDARDASSSARASSCARCSRRRGRRPQRIVYAEGEDERVLRAVQTDGGRRASRSPILIGRATRSRSACSEMGLRISTLARSRGARARPRRGPRRVRPAGRDLSAPGRPARRRRPMRRRGGCSSRTTAVAVDAAARGPGGCGDRAAAPAIGGGTWNT